jgi:iron complex transport system substrate-binding protein
MLAPSLEAIVKLAPDVAVLSAEGNPPELKKRLEGLGIRTYMFGEKRLDEFPAGIRRLGEALSAREGAEKAAEEIESAIKGIKERNKRRARLKALYIIWPEPLIAAGRGSAISDAMEVFNLENIADGAPSSYPKFSLEEIMRRSPDVIFFGGGHENMKEASQRLLGRLPTVSAVKNGRIYYASDYLNRLSPGFIKGMEEMELLLTGSRETSPAPQADEPEDE